jgi:transketolase
MTDIKETPRLIKLRQQQEKLKKQIQLEKNKQAKEDRNIDTRRKILDGALIQNHAKDNPEILTLLNKLRRDNLTRDNDRALFNLQPLPKTEIKKEA